MKLLILSTILSASCLALLPGCATTATPGVNGSPATVTVNTNQLNFDLVGMDLVAVPLLNLGEFFDPAIVPIYQDVVVGLNALDGTGATPAQILATAQSKNAALNTKLTPLVSIVQALETKYLAVGISKSARLYVVQQFAQHLASDVQAAIPQGTVTATVKSP